MYEDVQFGDSALPPVVSNPPDISPNPPSIYIPPIEGSTADRPPVIAANDKRNLEEANSRLSAAEDRIKKLDEENRRLQNELVAKEEADRKHSVAYPKEDTAVKDSPLDEEPEIVPAPIPEPKPEKTPLAKLRGYRGIEVVPEGTKIRIMIPDSELFLTGTYDFLPSSEDIFSAVMREIDNEYKSGKLSVEAHTEKFALGLTENGRPVEISTEKAFEITSVKSKSVMDRLVAGDYAKRERFLNASGYGFGVPVDDSGTELAREKNRRIEIVVNTDK